MNQSIKYVGMLAILPLFVIGLGPDYIGYAFAANVGSQDTIGRPGYDPNKVCGDRLCSESTTDAPIKKVSIQEPKGDPPVVEIVAVNNFSGDSENTFNAVLEVSAATQNLENVQILVESDIDQVLAEIGSVFAHDSVINTVKIQANDPTSVVATIANYQLND